VSFFSQRTKTSRRPRWCGECNCSIAIGEQYSSFAFVDEYGDFHSGETCLLCRAMSDRAVAVFRFDSWTLGELRQMLRDEGVADPEAWAREALSRSA
jgi:hypothetical protein